MNMGKLVICFIILVVIAKISAFNFQTQIDTVWKNKIPQAIGNIVEKLHKKSNNEVKIFVLMPTKVNTNMDYTFEYILKELKCDYCIFTTLTNSITLPMLSNGALVIVFFNTKDVSVLKYAIFIIYSNLKYFRHCSFMFCLSLDQL